MALVLTDTAIFSCRSSRHGIIADVMQVRWLVGGSFQNSYFSFFREGFLFSFLLVN